MNHWEDFWSDARNADIQEVAQRTGAKLKRVGADWIGACPNGCAKTDGFIVTPAKGIFFCRPSAVVQVDGRVHVLGRRAPTALGVIGSVRPAVRSLLGRVKRKSDAGFFDRITTGRKAWDERCWTSSPIPRAARTLFIRRPWRAP